MAHRHQKGELLTGFLEDLPRIMMMQQQMELSERRLDIADREAMSDARYRVDALAQAKETEKNNLYNDLLLRVQGDTVQEAIVHRQFGREELGAKAEEKGIRQENQRGMLRNIYKSSVDESLGLMGGFFNTADPDTQEYKDMLVYRDKQIKEKYIDYDEIRDSGKYGAEYRALEEKYKTQITAGAKQSEIELTEKQMDRVYREFSGILAKSGELGTQGLPDVDDYNDEVADYILKGTVVDVTSEAERYKDIPGYGILPEEELEKLYQESLPADKPAEVDDIKKISESDLFSNVKLKTTKQRAQIIGKILGREVSEEESEKLILDIGSAALKESGKEFLSGVATSIAKMPRTPIRSGQYMVD